MTYSYARLEKTAGTNTPWGTSDSSRQIVRGVVMYSTPSHGGLRVSGAVARENLSKAAIREGEVWSGAYWYEEDSAVEIPFFEMPDWYLRYCRLTGAVPTPLERRELYLRQHFKMYFMRKEREMDDPKVGDVAVAKRDITFSRGRVVPAGTKVTFQGEHKLNFLYKSTDGFQFTLSPASDAVEWV